jgi:hypothetical protein
MGEYNYSYLLLRRASIRYKYLASKMRFMTCTNHYERMSVMVPTKHHDEHAKNESAIGLMMEKRSAGEAHQAFSRTARAAIAHQQASHMPFITVQVRALSYEYTVMCTYLLPMKTAMMGVPNERWRITPYNQDDKPLGSSGALRNRLDRETGNPYPSTGKNPKGGGLPSHHCFSIPHAYLSVGIHVTYPTRGACRQNRVPIIGLCRQAPASLAPFLTCI